MAGRAESSYLSILFVRQNSSNHLIDTNCFSNGSRRPFVIAGKQGDAEPEGVKSLHCLCTGIADPVFHNQDRFGCPVPSDHHHGAAGIKRLVSGDNEVLWQIVE